MNDTNIERMDAQREASILEGTILCNGREHEIAEATSKLGELQIDLIRILTGNRTGSAAKTIMELLAGASIALNELELMFGDPTEQEIDQLLDMEGRLLKREQ